MDHGPVVDEGVSEDLRKLQSLLDDGVITESEFTEKKRQLLDQRALPATRAAPPGETPPPPKKMRQKQRRKKEAAARAAGRAVAPDDAGTSAPPVPSTPDLC